MSVSWRRRAADRACRVVQAVLPPSLHGWGWAVRCETAGIADDREALLFALDSLSGLLPRAVAGQAMRLLDRPRMLGTLCAVGSVALGLAYLTGAGAPLGYRAVNAGALVFGLAALALVGRVRGQARWGGGAIAVMAAALLATALMAAKVEGAARWVSLGGLSVQPSLILLPLLLVAFARHRDGAASAGMMVAVAAMALQPDRAMAAMLALGLAVQALARRDRCSAALAAVGAAGFAVTLARADALPAVPYVDGILMSAFGVHPVAGVAVVGGSMLLLVPALAGIVRDPARRAVHASFGAAWLAVIGAAALGNYPTPLVGYGGSAILGYALSLLALPRVARRRAGAAAAGAAGRVRRDHHMLLRAA